MTMNSRALQETSLRYFLAVVKNGSISEASLKLNVAASAISRQIARLEYELGTQLFERRARGMIPSAAGELLAAHARRMQLETDRVASEIQALQGLERGTVRLASSEGFAVDFIPLAIAEFRRLYKGIQFRLSVSSPAEVTRKVREGEADIGLTFSLAPERDIQVESRQRSRIQVLMSHAHPLAGRHQVTLAQLQAYPIALPPLETTLRQLFDICCSQQNLIFESIFTSNYTEALVNFAILGGGIALAGEISVHHRLLQDRLVAMPIRDAGMDARHVELQTLANRTLPAATEAFLAHLKAKMEIDRT
ncbi:LysR family transcriptional regulator [Salinicola rhizosphaerae]|uniref:LysR family transcriptional regulator n=1 Tax=Salinicola rhizosphaerae TaxID=1443141 RepID=A0ABQ3E2I8_9GAMM|nr:LysR family transcriptional regulator [Salinicola rhizosphaerae]GHB21358.1 LysR family transcriptional regulator [Salinicola rhizosphaerae]